MKSDSHNAEPDPVKDCAAHLLSETGAVAANAPIDSDWTIIFDQNDVIILWADRATEYLGYPPEDVIGRLITDLFPGPEFPLPSESQIIEHMTRFGGYSRVHMVRHQTGKSLLFRVSAVVHRLSSGRLLRCIGLVPVDLSEDCGGGAIGIGDK